MLRDVPHNFKIVIALIIAFLLSHFLSQYLFLSSSPLINSYAITSIPRRLTGWLTSLTPRFPTPTGISPTTSSKISVFSSSPSTSSQGPLPTFAGYATSPPLATVTNYVKSTPTSTPYIWPSPTATPYFFPTTTPTSPPWPTPTPRPINCPSSSNQAYDTLSINPQSFNASTNPDINLSIRGYIGTNAPLTLVNYSGATDPSGPQLSTAIGNGASFSSAYQVYDWNWSTNSRGGPITDWPVTLLGLSASAGQAVHVPNSGYNIGGGHQVIVLYADSNRVTLKYTIEDNVVNGYTAHIEGFCTDPNLLSLYQRLNGSGRTSLPALFGNQLVGTAQGTEVKIAIRDTGSFMDPRSRKDWWQGY